jgi:DNA-directed RNA polymerase specialized sigma24 family protein
VEIYKRANLRAAEFNARRQSPLNWLIALARDLAVSRLRNTAAAAEPSRDLFSHKRSFAAFALARLSDEQRSILEMTYLGGLSAAEAAAILGMPVGHVTAQLVLAAKKLRAVCDNPAGVVVRINGRGM